MRSSCFIFFFNDTATTEIYTLSLHDALPISGRAREDGGVDQGLRLSTGRHLRGPESRSEEHTSELQSHSDLVCRLLLEKKKKQPNTCEMEATEAIPSITLLNMVRVRLGTQRH